MAVALLVWLGVGSGDSPAPLPPAPAAAPQASAPAQAPAVEPDTASQEGPVRVKKTPIVLTGTGSIGSWVQVRGRDEKGRVVFERILAPGQAKVFKVVDGIWVRAANPGELQVTVNGKPVELDATATANFQIGREGAEVVELTPRPARRARPSSSRATRCFGDGSRSGTQACWRARSTRRAWPSSGSRSWGTTSGR